MGETQQLLDALTSHISLYHSSNTDPNPNPSPRNSILRWFSSLPPSTRQSTLTLTDPKFVRIILDMSSRLESSGHGTFFLLPDLPSSTDPSLPSFCFRRARGLLDRAAKPDSISGSLLLFGSKHEEDLDSLTVDEGFVSNVELFVEAMDVVSGGGFLRGEEKGVQLEKEWAELGWLKEKGYFSLEAFVANRLEVELRNAWRGCGRGGGRKGKCGRGKEETMGGTGAGALWRKKGCVDWWEGLDLSQRKEICTGFLGKAAKSLVIIHSEHSLGSSLEKVHSLCRLELT